MQEFLLLDMYKEPYNPMEIGWARVTVHDDHTLELAKIESSRSLNAEQVAGLISEQTLIVKNTGTIYRHLRNYIPAIAWDNKPCKKIIGITNIYTTDKNRPEDGKFILFSTVRSEFGLAFRRIPEYAKKYGIEPPRNGVSDSIMLMLMLLDVDMIDRLQLWQAPSYAKRKKS